MSTRHCVLCGEAADDEYQTFTITLEARAIYERNFPSSEVDSLLAQNVLCARCRALSAEARAALARDAITRELEAHRKDLSREALLKRINIARSIDTVALTEETWDWLNLIGGAMTASQSQARAHDANAEWFASPDDFKRIVVPVIAKDINTLGAIFMALRCEWTHQAATLVRTLCESLISFRYIAQDKVSRSQQFLNYALIEQYRAVESLLDWESGHSKPEHVERMQRFRATIAPKYEEMRPQYTFTNRKSRQQRFSNWCNKHISEMARETHSDRLYRVVYTQTSPYVHGSAWSLRMVPALTARGYDARRALIDTSMLIRATLSVWFEWAAFCDEELGWTLTSNLDVMKERLDELQAALDATTPMS